MNHRVDQLRALLTNQNLDALLITGAANRRYGSGFTGSSGALLVMVKGAWLVTDFRYLAQAGQQAPRWTLHRQTLTLRQAIADLLGEVAPERLGFEADTLTVADYNFLQDKSPATIEWVPTEGLIGALRAIKDAEEIEAIRGAQAITNAVGAELPYLIEPGQSERAVAWAIEQRLRAHGAEALAFPVTVASGPNGALPHHTSGERVIQPDEAVIVDFGARLHGYHSDTTRTFFTGEPSDAYRRVYRIVLAALDKAKAALRPGLGLKAGDALARDRIAAEGHGEHFGHGLGHGVGLEIHERPALSFRATDEAVLEAGNIITVEPGIYLPGTFGTRIEDLMLITDAGCEALTRISQNVDAWREARAAGMQLKG